MTNNISAQATRNRSESGHWRLWLASTLVLLLLSGCAAIPTAPLAALNYRAKEAAQQRNLLVLLRGLGADNSIFAEEGIIEEIRQRGLPFDVVAPDIHYGYYQAKTFDIRLKEDIIDPARRQGYEKIWLAGFSMGGLGCLIYLRNHAADVDGVLLTSPFLGWPAIHRDIQRAGGIASWTETGDDPDDWERMIWTWIKKRDVGASPPIWLGYGSGDMLSANGPALLASVLPSEHVFSVPGNHTLSTFKTIFLRHLDTLAGETQSLAIVNRTQATPFAP